jgi:hypothetical protein
MAAAREEGLIKLVLTDPNSDVEKALGQWRTSMHFPDAAKTNLSLAPYIPFGMGRTILREDSKIKVYMYADAADTFDYTDMTEHVNIPVTIYNLTTGHVEYKNLQVADVDLAADPTTIATTWVLVAEYSVPKRCMLAMGQPFGSSDNPNSRFIFIPMDDTA